MTGWRLVADIGGSNVRFARSLSPRDISGKRVFQVTDFTSFHDALDAYLSTCGDAQACEGAAIGVAGPMDDGRTMLTNAPWTIEAASISTQLAGAPVALVNDLQAVALALPYLDAKALAAIGDGKREPLLRRTMIAVNVGTGFGAASAIPAGAGWIANAGEPGHMTLGALSEAQLEMIENGARSIEDILSGRGVIALYNRIADRLGQAHTRDLMGAAIFSSAGHDRIAGETLREFSSLLGRIAGDLALAAAAWDGVYLCGGVVNGWAAAGGGRFFRTTFEDKGAMSARMKQVYAGVITHEDVGLLGLTYLPPTDV